MSSWSLVLDENSCLSLDVAQRLIKEHFLDLFLSKPGRYSRYSRYSRYLEGGPGGTDPLFCFLDGGGPGLGTCERGALTERSKRLGPCGQPGQKETNENGHAERDATGGCIVTHKLQQVSIEESDWYIEYMMQNVATRLSEKM